MRAGGSETGSIAVIGDSTFLHSGLTGLLNAVHQRTNVTVLIQDNSITAMTGGQTNPGNERTLAGAETKPVDIAGICKALGVSRSRSSTRTTTRRVSTALKAGLAYDGPAVIITNRPCMLFPRKIGGEAFTVDEDVCNACQQCMKLGCPSLLAHRGRAQGPPQGDDRRGDLHRLLAVRAALQAGGDREGEGRCGVSARRDRRRRTARRGRRRPALPRRRGRRHHGRRRRRPGRDRGRRGHRRHGDAARRPRGQAVRDPRHEPARRQRELAHPHRRDRGRAEHQPRRGGLPARVRVGRGAARRAVRRARRRRHRQHAADRAAARLAGRHELPVRRGRAHGRRATGA